MYLTDNNKLHVAFQNLIFNIFTSNLLESQNILKPLSHPHPNKINL